MPPARQTFVCPGQPMVFRTWTAFRPMLTSTAERSIAKNFQVWDVPEVSGIARDQRQVALNGRRGDPNVMVADG